MRKIILLIFAVLTIVSCKDEENTFLPSCGSEAFSFTPMAGGAVMHYKLPVENDIMGLNVRYKDFRGKDVLYSASALSDSLTLTGFNQAQSNVPAEVRLVNKNGEESKPIAVSFSTYDSAPYAFFDHVKVASGWNGFSVTTDNPKGATGMGHVFYLGKDPRTGEPDTILINSFNLTEGKDTMKFEVKQESPENTIVIRTEDFRGYMVREESYPHIISYNTEKLDPSKFDFYCDKSVEDPEYMIGKEYLFDGDINGVNHYIDLDGKHLRTFIAGPQAINAPMYIDMHKNLLTAKINIGAIADVNTYLTFPKYLNKIFWGACFVDKMPCEVEVYGAKDDNGSATDWDSKQWVRVASFSESRNIEPARRWCAKTYQTFPNGIYDQSHIIRNKEKAEKADPMLMPLNLMCEGQGEGYRYLKIVVKNVFEPADEESEFGLMKGRNVAEYITFNELEVYTKKN